MRTKPLCIYSRTPRYKHCLGADKYPSVQEIVEIILILDDCQIRQSGSEPLGSLVDTAAETRCRSLVYIERAHAWQGADDHWYPGNPASPAPQCARFRVVRVHDMWPQGAQLPNKRQDRSQITARADAPRQRVMPIVGSRVV